MMFAAELNYRSWVALGGYRWVKYEDLGRHRGMDGHPMWTKGWVLTESDTVSSQSDVPRRYRAWDVFHEHTLYRELAALPWGDREAALGFATRYGLLESDSRMYYPAAPLPEGVIIHSRKHSIPCDPEEHWYTTSAKFRGIIRVWEARKAKRVRELSQLFRWEKRDNWHMWVWHPNREQDDSQDLPFEFIYPHWHQPEKGTEDSSSTAATPHVWPESKTAALDGMSDLLDVADAFLRQEVSKGLDRGHPYSMRLVCSAESDEHFEVAPNNLLGALYLQLGRAIAGDKVHRSCPVCRKWFELVPQDKGRKEFCSATCKVKENRERKRRAVELGAAGRTHEQIAEETNTSLKTVKRWVVRKNSTKKRKED